jgi:hypothetical protein
MRSIYIFFAVSVVLFSGCQKGMDRRKSDVKDIDEFKKTEILPTLESPLSNGKNAIYCSTLLLAWDLIRTELKGDLGVDSIHHDLFLLNKSTSFSKSLSKDEYTSSVMVKKGILSVDVEFKKSLPFTEHLTDLGTSLIFNKSNVQSFGAQGGNEQVEILYYKNDGDFIIKLKTKDDSNELILYRVDSTYQTLIQAIQSVNLKTIQGVSERFDDRYYGNYSFNSGDNLIVPKIKFNIESYFPKMSNKIVYNNKNELTLMEMYQRTAFKLNEFGVEIEGEARVLLGDTQMENQPKWKPKNLIFDKPFILILRKRNTENPYFVMLVRNDELMMKTQ